MENNPNLSKQCDIIATVHFQKINTRSAKVKSWKFKLLCKIFRQLNVDNWFKVDINSSSSHPSQAKSLHAKLKDTRTRVQESFQKLYFSHPGSSTFSVPWALISCLWHNCNSEMPFSPFLSQVHTAAKMNNKYCSITAICFLAAGVANYFWGGHPDWNSKDQGFITLREYWNFSWDKFCLTGLLLWGNGIIYNKVLCRLEKQNH